MKHILFGCMSFFFLSVTISAQVERIIETDILPPKGFYRSTVDQKSFCQHLRQLPLKSEGSPVLYYNRDQKPNNNVYTHVVDLPIGNKDLHQCADAVMRLRAEYLWKQERYEDIHFNFTNGFRVDYSKWMAGYRMRINGNKTFWEMQQQPSNSYDDLWNYLELIFMYAGTSSLEKELTKVSMKDVRVGDVFIQGGFPGHAVIIVDEAEDECGEKRYLLAQSYMPAQELQILVNPSSENSSPWYVIEQGIIATPEWTFHTNDLRRFPEN